MLDWKTLVPSNDPRHLTRGTEIEACRPEGFASRFAIYSVRTVEREWIEERRMWASVFDVRYRVRDAETVTLEQVKQGVRPAVFGEFATLDEALAAIEPFRVMPFVEA